MIAYIEGRLAEVWGNACLVLTEGGVGYEVALPAHTLAALPGKGASVALYTSLAVREDALELFGFTTFEERQTFEVLVSISKVEDAPQAAALLAVGRPGSVFRDVLDGLANLGYAEEECAPLVKNLLHEEPDLDVTGALRAALKALARGRA